MASFLISELFNRNYWAFASNHLRKNSVSDSNFATRTISPQINSHVAPFQRETASPYSHRAFVPLLCEVILHVRASVVACFSSQEQMAGPPN